MINIFKWIPLIINGMRTVEKIKNASGKDKLNAVLEDLGDRIDDIEGALGRDLLDNAAVNAALISTIAAIKHLENVVAAAKVAVNK
jgi:hypothetical protein